MLPLYALAQIIKKLKKCNFIEFPDMEAKILLQEILQLSLSKIITSNVEISSSQIDKIEQFVEMRQNGMPIAKIIENIEFCENSFYVNKHVLDPRADSVAMIDAIYAALGENHSGKILELGVGSGALVITILLKIQNLKGFGVDISNYAIDISRKNAINLGVIDRLNLRLGNWLDSFSQDEISSFDLIFSNPPYLSKEEMEKLDIETSYDPHLALYADHDGLAEYIKILEKLEYYNNPILFEIAPHRIEMIKQICNKMGFECNKIIQDRNNKDRVILIQKH